MERLINKITDKAKRISEYRVKQYYKDLEKSEEKVIRQHKQIHGNNHLYAALHGFYKSELKNQMEKQLYIYDSSFDVFAYMGVLLAVIEKYERMCRDKDIDTTEIDEQIDYTLKEFKRMHKLEDEKENEDE